MPNVPLDGIKNYTNINTKYLKNPIYMDKHHQHKNNLQLIKFKKFNGVNLILINQ